MSEPDANPAPHHGRRRRLLIVVAIVVASLASWWYWPRGDARFVGKWNIVFPNWNTQNENKSPVREFVMTLRPNGTGSWRPADFKSDSETFRWKFDGTRLVFGEESPARYTSKPLNALAWGYEKLTGRRWLLTPLTLRVQDLGQRAITFDVSRSKTPWTIDFRPIVPSVMTRIPE